MTFTWPLALLGLLAVPLLLGTYLWQLRRRRKRAVRYPSVALIRAALPPGARWKRHVPVGLLLAGLGGMAVAAARPQTTMTVPLGRTTIMLALDISRSMCATDVAPNRMAVAQAAARQFVQDQPEGTRIGVVAFAGFAEVVVPPTTDTEQLVAAIDGLTTARGTVIGAATLKAIDALAEVNPDIWPSGTDRPGDAPAAPAAGDGAERAYVPDIVVLLTDGANTRGIDPIDAAQQAADRRVRVYTIGFGTTNPTSMMCTREQLGGEAFGGGFGGGGFGGGGFGGTPDITGGGARSFLVIDEPTLTEVARLTGGEFYKAEDAEQLQRVFSDLPRQVELQEREREVSAVFVGAGLALAALAVALSLRWNKSL